MGELLLPREAKIGMLQVSGISELECIVQYSLPLTASAACAGLWHAGWPLRSPASHSAWVADVVSRHKGPGRVDLI